MKRLYEFVENDRIRIRCLTLPSAQKAFFDAIGFYIGSEHLIFLKDKKRVILKTGKTKYAFSGEIAEKIFAIKIKMS